MYRRLLAAFALALAMSAVAASAAFAAPEWYSSTTKPKPEWQQGGARLSESVATKMHGTVTLADKGAFSVTCEDTGEGSAGPGAVDKETSIVLSNCSKSEQCKTLYKAVMAYLPWHTELVPFEKSLRDAITSEVGGKTPGFGIECETAVGRLYDSCNIEASNPLSTTAVNVSSGVDATFVTGKARCSVGGAGQGVLEGTQLIEATRGSKLEANTVVGTFSKLTSSLGVKAKGGLTIEDEGYGIGAGCNVETEGTIEAGGKGKITHYYATGCTPKGNSCRAVVGDQAINLPWKTELYESEGVVRDRVVSGGNGTPSWEFVCETSLGNTHDTCYFGSPGLENYLEGTVAAIFNERFTSGMGCTASGEYKGLWQGSLVISPPEGVGAIEAK